MQGRYCWMEYVPKVCREDCFRIGADEAQALSIAVSHFRNISGLHALCICPECGKRVRYLYRPPIVKACDRFTPRESLPHAENWACGRCHNLVFRSQQRSGTRAAMREASERDYKEFKRLYPDGGFESGVSFSEFQKWKHRSYNRKKLKSRDRFRDLVIKSRSPRATVLQTES